MFNIHKLQCVLYHHHRGYKAATIGRLQSPKNLKASRVRIAKSDGTGNVERRLGSGRPSKITAEIGEAAFREALRPVIIHLSFSISPCSNVQNFSSHAHQILNSKSYHKDEEIIIVQTSVFTFARNYSHRAFTTHHRVLRSYYKYEM